MTISTDATLSLARDLLSHNVCAQMARLVSPDSTGSDSFPVQGVEPHVVESLQRLLAEQPAFILLVQEAAAAKGVVGEAVVWQSRDTMSDDSEWCECERSDAHEMALPWMEYRALGVMDVVRRGDFRPQFEAWMRRENYGHELLWDDARECYAREFAQGRWEAWTSAMKRNAIHAPLPANVMDLWPDAFAAFNGAFDTPICRRKLDDEYSVDARSRMREFNEAIQIAVLEAEAKKQAGEGLRWPKSKDVGRMGDMTPTGQSVLRVGLDNDNDVYVEVWDHGSSGRADDYHSASLEFCTPGGGGGQSSATRKALIALMVAMEEDNRALPHKAWPAVKNS